MREDEATRTEGRGRLVREYCAIQQPRYNEELSTAMSTTTARSTTGSSPDSAAAFFFPFFLLLFFLTTPSASSTAGSDWTSMVSGSRSVFDAMGSARRGRGTGGWYLRRSISKEISWRHLCVREFRMLLEERKSGSREHHQHVRRVLLPRSAPTISSSDHSRTTQSSPLPPSSPTLHPVQRNPRHPLLLHLLLLSSIHKPDILQRPKSRVLIQPQRRPLPLPFHFWLRQLLLALPFPCGKRTRDIRSLHNLRYGDEFWQRSGRGRRGLIVGF